MTDTERDLVKMLVASARKASFLELEAPKIHDLVVETSTFRIDPDGIGWLVDRRGPAHSPTLLVIRTIPDGREVRWQNATVRRMPDALAELARKLFPLTVPVSP